METAYFAAGCFWGVEDAFRNVKGVSSVRSGYAGGHTANPSYDEVCSGTTGHAETVEVTYDAEQVSYDDLLRVFFTIHDPSQKNRQGPDIGEQYRSAVFYTTEEQRSAAERVAGEVEAGNGPRRVNGPVQTQIESAETFYPAEGYHQRYFEKHGFSNAPAVPEHLRV
ncbi:MAG: peptide-methionine (S)-S-oxide reductase MsrA [Spirochaetes bacterium]|jgi:peptide-methionine (S)-S-oxide reductase|nr:peptide-methionine (S)-S-oxide reductase MsrA [Spirochaetota bacterium]